MATVVVPGLVEAIESFHCELRGRPIWIRGRDAGRQGQVVRAGHPLVNQHVDSFVPLEITVDFDDER